MTIINTELVANTLNPVLVSNACAVTNATANAVRITLAGLSFPTVYGSCTPAEGVQVSLYVGANGLSNDALILTQGFPIADGAWAADLLVGKPATVASNTQIAAVALSPALVISAPTSNATINIANTGDKLSVYVSAAGGGSNGSITVETGVLSNVS